MSGRDTEQVRRWSDAAESTACFARVWSNILLVAGCSQSTSEQISFQLSRLSCGLCGRRQSNLLRAVVVVHVDVVHIVSDGVTRFRTFRSSPLLSLGIGRILEYASQPVADVTDMHFCHRLLQSCRSDKARRYLTASGALQRAHRELLAFGRARSW